MPSFLDDFLNEDKTKQVIATDVLPPATPSRFEKGERDTLMLDASLFAEEDSHAHDHSMDDKIGSCGNSCGGCSKRGTPACGDH